MTPMSDLPPLSPVLDRLRDHVLEHSVKHGEFTLKSGATSSWFLDVKHEGHANADGKMTDAEKDEYLKKFEAGLIAPAELARWNRGASNAGYHYLGCAKTFALMGKRFAEANIELLKIRK